MRDLDVRFAVRRMLDERHRGDTDTFVVEEMGIWSGSVRVDVAIINGEFHGFELKSHRDTLERLPAQAELYNQVFDRVTLVVAARHAAVAQSMVEDWWGLTVASPAGLGIVELTNLRGSRLNPNIDPRQLARLLWRPETLAILERYGLDRGVRSRPIEVLTARLTEKLTLDSLRFEVREALKRRCGWLGQRVGDHG